MPASKVRVTIRGGDPAADVLLLDSLFNRVARGCGVVRTEVVPGLYLARAIAANGVEEKPVLVRGDTPEIDVTLPLVRFDSPIPLDHTRTCTDVHQRPVAQALRASLANPAANRGGLLLCLRDATKPPRTRPEAATAAYRQAYQGFRLLDADDTVVLDVDALPEALHLADGLLLHEARLPVGRYQFEWKPPGGTAMRLPAIVLPMMTTQWYALVHGADVAGWLPDLANAAVAFTWEASAIGADSLEMRLAEQARHSLARGANLVSAPHLDEMLRAKFENPMLGVLGAHLLLLARDPQLDLIEVVLGNTAGLLGEDFPDVVALRLRFAALTRAGGAAAAGAAPVPFPPLLRRSWDYLLEAAATRPDLIPAGSLAARVAGSLVNNGIWLAWRPQPAPMARSLSATAPPAEKEARTSGGAPGRPRSISVATAAAAWLERAMRHLRRPAPTATAEDAALRAARAGLEQLLDKIIHGRTARGLDTADPGREPAERARDLVIALVDNVDWDAVIRQLRRREAGGQLAAGLSDVQKALLPSLRFAQQYLEDGGRLDRRFVEGMATSLGVPLTVLLDSLSRLLGDLVGIASGNGEPRP